MFPFIQLLHITSINVPPVSAFKQQSFTQRLLVDYDPSTMAERSVVLSNLIYQLVSFLHGTNFSQVLINGMVQSTKSEFSAPKVQKRPDGQLCYEQTLAFGLYCESQERRFFFFGRKFVIFYRFSPRLLPFFLECCCTFWPWYYSKIN